MNYFQALETLKKGNGNSKTIKKNLIEKLNKKGNRSKRRL